VVQHVTEDGVVSAACAQFARTQRNPVRFVVPLGASGL